MSRPLSLSESIDLVKCIKVVADVTDESIDTVLGRFFFLFSKEQKESIQVGLNQYNEFAKADLKKRAEMMGWTVEDEERPTG